jgi:trimethylamine--corrinoid protein Co-methyltransferase
MNSWEVISEEDVESIHHATLRILGEVGIEISHPGIKDRLLDAGATLKGDRIRIPQELVEKSIASCGKKVTIFGRKGEEIVLGDGKLHWHNVGGASEVYDPISGQPHPATIEDLRNSTRLLDVLDHVTIIPPKG